MACETMDSLNLPKDRFWRLAIMCSAITLESKHVAG